MGITVIQKNFPVASNYHCLGHSNDGIGVRELGAFSWSLEDCRCTSGKAPEGTHPLLTSRIESPARHDQTSSKHSLFSLVNLSKPYLLLAFQQARFIKGEMSVLGLAPPCPRSVGNQSGHFSKWHFVIISAYVKPI